MKNSSFPDRFSFVRMFYMMIKYIVGIDEAGRGPLAGPVAVGLVCIPIRQYNSRAIKTFFKGVRDSKKMTIAKREEIFQKIKQETKKQQSPHILRYIVRYESAKTIDTKGISWAVHNCITKCLKKLAVNPKQTLVLLDGGIKAPSIFTYQKTIIRGDDKELIISLASICAKVSRDAHMVRLAKKYPRYGLDIHKGYGTLQHRKAIKKHGPSREHRKTFIKRLF